MKILYKDLIPPITTEEYIGLESSIMKEGCRDSLVVWNDILLDGHNRYEICQKHHIPFNVVELDLANHLEAEEWIIRNQFSRRNLTPFQRAELALKLKGVIEKKAKENQRLSKGPKKRIDDEEKGSPTLAKVSQPIDTREELSKTAGISHGTMSKVQKIVEEGSELVKERLRKGEISINEAHKEIRSAEREERKMAIIDAIENEAPPLPEGPFRVIVIDPPWKYDNRDEDASHRGRAPYPSMSIEEIRFLPVDSLAHDDCVLWLWTTNAFIHEAFHLLNSWYFSYKTLLTWDKTNLGLGDYLRNVTEHCLLAIKGKPTLTLTNQTTLIVEKRREHSRKPEAFYQLVDSLCPGTKLEMFAREKRDNWTQWGVNK